jgi:hypothetical protein
MRLNRPVHSFVVASFFLSFGLTYMGCAPEEEDDKSRASPAFSGQLSAPVGLDFSTTRIVNFQLRQSEFAGLGALVFLKISLQPDYVEHLFLGQIDTSRDFSVEFTVPRTAQELHYELYDELGTALRNVQMIP